MAANRTAATRVRDAWLQVPGARLPTVPLRVAGLAWNAWVRQWVPQSSPDLPALPLTRASLGAVAVDEAVLAIMKSPRRFPAAPELERVGEELAAARKLYGAKGWAADPTRYHRTPPRLLARDVVRAPATSRGVAYERWSWPSGFTPRPGEPGAERWDAHGGNATAHASALVHDDDPDRPWVVAIHGLGTGRAMADFLCFRVEQLHRELGCNVLLPVLPLHGARKAHPLRIDEFLTFDLVDAVHAVTQSVWDVRRLLGFVRSLGDGPIAAHGVSLGAYVTALTSGLTDDLDLVIAGVPLVDIPSLYALHCPPAQRKSATAAGALGLTAQQVHRVISPLAVTPNVPVDRRFIYAGLGDRMTTADQAHRLWAHWDRPRVHWYPGNHMGFVWDASVGDYVLETLRAWSTGTLQAAGVTA